jgi:hypothetical protein
LATNRQTEIIESEAQMDETKLFWMVWAVDQKAAEIQTLTEALAYYTKKYGQAANRVRVPPSWPDLNGQTPPGISIEKVRFVQSGHIHVTYQAPTDETAPSEEPAPMGAVLIVPAQSAPASPVETVITLFNEEGESEI